MQEGDGRRLLGRRRDREEACFICGHYHDHENGEPCATCGHVMAPQLSREVQAAGILPTGVIPGELYLGSYDTASRSELLKAMGITHILNTVPACQALFKNTFTYHTVSASPPDFQECYDFMEGVHKSGGKILVYCMSGISRSPTVVIAYLMRHRGWRLAESFKWVKEKRPTININPDDTKRLVDLELRLHKSCSVPNGLSALHTSGNLFSLAPSAPADPSTAAHVAEAPATAQPAAGGTPSAPFAALSSWTMPTALPQFSFGGGGAAATSGGGGPAFVFGSPAPAPQAVAASEINDSSAMES